MNLFVVENSFLYYLKSTSSVPVELVNEGSSQESIIAAVADGTDSENSKAKDLMDFEDNLEQVFSYDASDGFITKVVFREGKIEGCFFEPSSRRSKVSEEKSNTIVSSQSTHSQSEGDCRSYSEWSFRADSNGKGKFTFSSDIPGTIRISAKDISYHDGLNEDDNEEKVTRKTLVRYKFRTHSHWDCNANVDGSFTIMFADQVTKASRQIHEVLRASQELARPIRQIKPLPLKGTHSKSNSITSTDTLVHPLPVIANKKTRHYPPQSLTGSDSEEDKRS